MKFFKICLVVIFMCLTATTLFYFFYISHHTHNQLEITDKPLVQAVIFGKISRNDTLITRWLKNSNFSTLSQLPSISKEIVSLAHYENSFPSARETKILQKTGLSLVTLPFIPFEDLPYIVEEKITDKVELQRDLAVLTLCKKENTLLLNLPLDISLQELIETIATYKETATPQLLIIKFTPTAQTDNENEENIFSTKAKAAAEAGAHIIIGTHTANLLPLEVYADSLIIPSLDFSLGGNNTESAFILFTLYEKGITVEVHPLRLANGLPQSLHLPWHYFQSKQILQQIAPAKEGFQPKRFKSVYISSSLLPLPEPVELTEPLLDPIETPLESEKKQAENNEGRFGVAAGHPLAVEVGMEILRAGGNAIDAAVAVSYALAVVEPHASGLGGGGIMLLHLAAENKQIVIDYRETAPFTMEQDEIGKIMNWPSTGIPGFVRGMEKALEKHGTMSRQDVLTPALNLARDGFPMSAELHTRVRQNSGKLARSQEALTNFFRRGWATPVGEIIKQPVLARTLEAIIKEGSKVFYEGYIADSIIKVLAQQGMHLSANDLARYRAILREPIQGNYRGYTVLTVPPPTGGFNLLQQLKILEHYDLGTYQQPTPEIYHLIQQTIRAVYSDRLSHVGDPRFVYVPLEELLSEEHILGKIDLIESGDIPMPMYRDPYRPSDNTTHIVVLDSAGNWVSVTNTISFFFGYGLQAEGFFLNTQLKNFSSNPRSPNSFQPGKRPFSHISPTLLFKDGTPFMALGTPGGRRIPAYLAQVIVQYVDFDANIEEAVAAPRFWPEGRKLYLEKGIPDRAISFLLEQGYQIIKRNPSFFFGRIAALHLDLETNKLTGTGDPLRGEGTTSLVGER